MARPSKYRKYTDEQKAMALARVLASTKPKMSGKIKEAAKIVDIPENTLRDWVGYGLYTGDELAERIMAEKVEEARESLSVRMKRELHLVLDQMNVKRKDATYNVLVLAAGILTDKVEKLDGNPTQNIRQEISFKREGITSLPQFAAPNAVESADGEETL